MTMVVMVVVMMIVITTTMTMFFWADYENDEDNHTDGEDYSLLKQ